MATFPLAGKGGIRLHGYLRYTGVHKSQLLEVRADNTGLWALHWAQLDLASGASLPAWAPGSCPVNIQVVSGEVEALARSKV